MSSFPQSFLSKKRTILSQLSIPAEEYDDLSPKGSIDVGIRELIDEINESEGWVTTSSCAGRVSIFLEGRRKDTAAAILEEESVGNGARLGDGEVGEVRAAGAGGKGGGGNWLFVSHDPVVVDDKSRGDLAAMLGMKRVDEKKEVQKHELVDDEILGKRFIHFKFEPMILHVLTASLSHAQIILSCALQAGFRESGAVNILPSGKEAATPIVAVRSQGTMLESLVGFFEDDEPKCNVQDTYLDTLLRISNERFCENERRIQRFRDELKKVGYGVDAVKDKRKGDTGEWEDPNVRRERKKAEGIRKSKLAKKEDIGAPADAEDISGLEFSEEQNT